MADFSINWAVYDHLFHETLSVGGKNGFVVTGLANKVSLRGVDEGKLKDFTAPPCVTMYQHFAACIDTGEKPLTNLYEGCKSLQLVRAIYQSIETGAPVNPETVTF